MKIRPALELKEFVKNLGMYSNSLQANNGILN